MYKVKDGYFPNYIMELLHNSDQSHVQQNVEFDLPRFYWTVWFGNNHLDTLGAAVYTWSNLGATDKKLIVLKFDHTDKKNLTILNLK